MDELLERSAAAYAASTRAELAALTGDLPGRTGEPEQPQRRGWRDPAWRLHLTLAVLVNAAVTGLWLLTRDPTPLPTDEGAGYWWPFWLSDPGGAGRRRSRPPPRPRPTTLTPRPTLPSAPSTR